MPELPEVETIKNELTPIVVGQVIRKIDILSLSTLRACTPDKLNAEVAGQAVTNLSRRGKYLVFRLESDKLLLVHHKMTGSFQASLGSSELPKHTRAIIHIGDRVALFFVDPRRFGRFELVGPEAAVLQKLGPEPLAREFTAKRLSEILARRNLPLKAVLLNQGIIAGIGNLYADEILFAARLSPKRLAGSLTQAEVRRMHAEIRRVLREGIARKGASLVNYYRPGGEKGGAHLAFQVARRAGQACLAGCGGMIERIFFRGRGTYYCPRCQQ
ncbi:MAG: bifunctional DNA-formamidopyrimidine glycosylase/DNA-(apurinic or apyrimidinic site) lyase [Dehalococcoidia bacterium]|nr:bifunctional DNA-formamidopyrimidine glycosylase/DNA-(apurinic or apyrimidinic site) lyase [Dehalococcoidia bacterium]